jgi:uncharacterized membrane protein YgaE (UPF0421/DUF939 family)
MKKNFAKLRPEFTFNEYSFINSLKATFACLIALLAVQIFHLDQPQWVLISILIVMAAQYRVGGAIKKGYARLFATALGSCLAAAILFIFTTHLLFLYSMLFVFITLFIYLASNSKEYSYSYTLGAVTMVIIVVSNNPQLHSALDRLIEIIMGVIIAILVSRFVLPIHAEKLLYQNIATSIEYLKKLYQLSIAEEKTFKINEEGVNLEEKIINSFNQQPQLFNEACAESSVLRQEKLKYVILLRLERRLLRSLYMLHHTLRISLTRFSDIIAMQEFENLHQQVVTRMEELVQKVQDKNSAFSHINLNTTYEEIINKLRTIFDKYSFEDKNKIHAFIFCLGHVIRILNRMERVLQDEP